MRSSRRMLESPQGMVRGTRVRAGSPGPCGKVISARGALDPSRCAGRPPNWLVKRREGWVPLELLYSARSYRDDARNQPFDELASFLLCSLYRYANRRAHRRFDQLGEEEKVFFDQQTFIVKMNGTRPVTTAIAMGDSVPNTQVRTTPEFYLLYLWLELRRRFPRSWVYRFVFLKLSLLCFAHLESSFSRLASLDHMS